MTVSHHPSMNPPINEELLSAYLDNEVTDEERSLVESAIAADPTIAWQVDSLRQTIHLLQELPAHVLPRAFTLEAVVADAKRQEALTTPVVDMGAPDPRKKPTAAKQASNEAQSGDWWQWLQQFWQGGNLQLRNAAALAFTLMLVLLVSNRFVAPYQPTSSQGRAPIITQTTTTSTGSASNVANSESTSVTAQRNKTPILEPSATTLTTQPLGAGTATQEQPVGTALAKQLPVQDETTATESTAMVQRMPAQGPGPDDDDFTESSPNPAMQSDQFEGMASTMQENARTATVERSTQAASASPSITLGLSTTITTTYNAEAQNATRLSLTPTAAVTATESVIVETITPSVSQSINITDSMGDLTTPEAEGGGMINEAANADNPTRWLGWAQMITALCAIVLGGLWWRSRE